jgi:hypothetical protein
MIDREHAVEIAREAARRVLDVPDDCPVEVEETDGSILVRFLATNPPGIRGPDFHAQVTLDAETGETLEVLAGS